MTMDGISDATWVAGLLALYGPRVGGALVVDDVADSFVAAYQCAAEQLRTVPASVSLDALTGAVDLAATLALGKPIHTPGLIGADTKARFLVRRAERLDLSCTSIMAQALDRNALMLVAVIDANDPDVALAPKLEVRLPFRVDGKAEPYWTHEDMNLARKHVTRTEVDEKWLRDLCEVALSIGITSPRTVLQAVGAARGIAALKGQETMDDSTVAMAARLVLAHRALYAPPQEQQPDLPSEQQSDQGESEPLPPSPNNDQTDSSTAQNQADADVILAAVRAALPAHLLQMMGEGVGKRGAGRNVKSSAPRKNSGQRGRRIGNKRAASLAGQRLDILATLRTAAPWQPLRRKMAGLNRMVVTRDDFRISRIKQRNEATAIFVVDASGSTAFQRLAEAKGAVETILAECYIRRDRVALVSFRGKKAELLLPPTRSLERAKRALSALPGGGGTPLAAGLDEAFLLAMNVRRGGGNPVVILLTDGRANVTRDGEGNKAKALLETQSAAALFAAERFDTMLIDVSPEPQKSARALAATMQATYLPMPRASATDIARPISTALKTAAA
jgi:magnesium chelatase subunit D